MYFNSSDLEEVILVTDEPKSQDGLTSSTHPSTDYYEGLRLDLRQKPAQAAHVAMATQHVRSCSAQYISDTKPHGLFNSASFSHKRPNLNSYRQIFPYSLLLGIH